MVDPPPPRYADAAVDAGGPDDLDRPVDRHRAVARGAEDDELASRRGVRNRDVEGPARATSEQLNAVFASFPTETNARMSAAPPRRAACRGRDRHKPGDDDSQTDKAERMRHGILPTMGRLPPCEAAGIRKPTTAGRRLQYDC